MTLNPAKLAQYARDPAEFRRDVMIEANGDVVPFGELMDPWQHQDFCALDGGWLRAIGASADRGYSRGYLERGRGHSKSSDIATMATWATTFAPRQVIGVIVAADLDQGRLLLDCVRRLLAVNPLLASTLEVQKNSVVNTRTGSEARVIGSDVGSSYGLLADWLVAEELSHWTSASEALWHSILSTAAKKRRCHLTVISNAGFVESWQWKVREAARQSENWYFSRLDGPVASWISPELLAEQRALLPNAAYDRLWENIWSSGSGDAIDPSDLAAAVTLAGPRNWDARYIYIAGLDLGVKRDATGFCVLELDAMHQRMRLAYTKAWTPLPNAPVSLDQVLKEVTRLSLRYRLRAIALDPWQGVLMSEQLRRLGIRVIDVPFTTKSLNVMATATLEVFRNRRIDLYDEPALMRDLGRLRIVETTLGYRLSAPRTRGEGHADLATALALAVSVARGWLPEMQYAASLANRPKRVLTP